MHVLKLHLHSLKFSYCKFRVKFLTTYMQQVAIPATMNHFRGSASNIAGHVSLERYDGIKDIAMEFDTLVDR